MSISLEVFLFWYCIFQFLFQLQFLLLSLFNVSLFRGLSINIYLKLSFRRIFEKLKLYPFHRGEVHSGNNCFFLFILLVRKWGVLVK